jgi:ATP-dependent Clp protease ATP-binding subunit ClpA
MTKNLEGKSVKFIDFYEEIKQGGKYQCLTPDGWKDIGDVYLKTNKQKNKVVFSSGREIIVSFDHLFEIHTNGIDSNDDLFNRIEFLDNGFWVRSKNLRVNDQVITEDGIDKIILIEDIGVGDTYDIEILSEEHRYWSNGISSHNTGKSAIAEGLALRIIQRKVSRLLYNKRVVTLDIASIVSGTKYRGQLEERIKAIMTELEKETDVILFIDEIHTIIGAGGSSGSLDVSNMLKPALARGEMQIIGATTLDEYRKHIEKDGALERRFQKVVVEPTSEEDTLLILDNVKDKYESHHNVIYSPEAIKACVELTSRYMSDRFLPDKALDALDEAGSRVHITNIVVPKEILEIEKKISDIKEEKTNVVKNQKYEEAAKLRDVEKQLHASLDIARKNWEEEQKLKRQIVTEDNVAEVVSMMTGVPLQKVGVKENEKLSNMLSSILGKVIGQDDAVKKIVKAIQRGRVGMKDASKPLISSMLIGASGVGKCIDKDTYVTLRNKITGKIEKITILDLIYTLSDPR